MKPHDKRLLRDFARYLAVIALSMTVAYGTGILLGDLAWRAMS